MPNVITKSGIDWHYDVEGEGEEVLLFFHGWGVDKRIWRQQIKHFREKYKTVNIDLPGHGKSSWEKISLEQFTHDIREMMEKENVSRFSAIGSSLGGLVGLKLYEQYPGMFERLIFVGSLPKFAKSDDFPYGLDVDRIRKLNSQVNSDYPSIINVFFRSLFTPEERRTRRFRWLVKFRKFEDPPLKPALVEYLDLLEQEDLRSVLKEVKVPVQFLMGKEDYICPAGSIEVLKELLPSARFDMFEQCGHFPFLSKAYEFNEALDKFLTKTKQ